MTRPEFEQIERELQFHEAMAEECEKNGYSDFARGRAQGIRDLVRGLRTVIRKAHDKPCTDPNHLTLTLCPICQAMEDADNV